MKKCDSCHKPDKLHYRVKSQIQKDWDFCCKEVGTLFLNIVLTPMFAQENLNYKLSIKLR